jgi:hypothetical protein
VSAFCSIQRDNRVTGANAMSASLAGSGVASLVLRTTLSGAGPALLPLIRGFHWVAGAMIGSSATFRGPTRRSRNGAMDLRQLAAAISRSAELIVTCTSFSASANVAAETGGPDSGPVPKVGGAPGVVGGTGGVPTWASVRREMIAARAPIGAVIRNRLRVFIDHFARWSLFRFSTSLRARGHGYAGLPSGSRVQAPP